MTVGDAEWGWTVPPVFVYGLLRPGERYWPELAPAVRSRRPARVRGALHLHAAGAYPMLVDDPGGWVAGDLLDVQSAPAVHALVFMELTAGYDARWADVHAPDGEDIIAQAVAFFWPWGARDRGPRIAGGDWQAR
jgi:gamma-glutamylcyclotransferase (GGCT)/AIG2-like uncharacterized protein YtfP